MKKSIVLVFLILSSSLAYSQGFFYQKSLPGYERDYERYVNNVYAMEDPKGSLDIHDIRSSNKGMKFLPKDSFQLFKPGIEAYWLKFKLKKAISPSLVITFNPAYSTVEYYKPDSNGSYRKEVGGFTVPSKKSNSKPVPDILFQLSTSDTISWHYLRVVAPNEPMGFGFSIYESTLLIDILTSNYLRIGIFFGLVFFALVFNMILFVQLRQILYLYYSLYVVCFALYVAAEWHLFSIFQLAHYKLTYIVYSLPFVGMTIFLLLYIYSFFPDELKFKRVRQVSLFMLVVRIMLYAIAHVFSANTFLFSMVVDMLCILLPFILILISAQNYRPARYLSIAIGLIILGYAAHFQLTYFNEFILKTFTIQNLGIIEILLLSVALGNRIKTTEKEKEVTQQQLLLELKEKQVFKDRLNQELEEKVEQRTQEINRMNQVLKDYNLHLEAEVGSLVTARVMQENVSLSEFKKIFPDEETCFSYLADLKWKEGFTCKFCNSTKFTFVNSPHRHSRRCGQCKKIESPTANTIFHKLKFPVEKAFYMLFLVNSGQKMTYEQLSEEVDLRVATCFAFKKKIIEAMEQKKIKKNQKVVWSDWILP